MLNLERLSRFTSDLTHRGLLYAIAHDRICSPVPLDPEENWSFWTQPQPSLLQSIARTYPPEPRRKAFLDSMLAQDHASGIEAHYDVSNDFYALFLDRQYRFYSCADFLDEKNTLEEAQRNKAMYLRSLLNLQGDEKVLELGCGWGAMLKLLREEGHRGELMGFTLSKEQLAYAQSLGLNASLTNFITTPFEGAAFDRILSVGALEHVRPGEIEGIYQKIYDALIPGGLAVHQFFSLEHEPYPASMVMVQLFFPGSLLVMHPVHLEAAERAGFRITHDSVHDYKPTLRAWYDRLVAHREQALKLVDLMTYNRYMTFFPISWLFFEQNEAKLHRVVLEKPLTDSNF